ncbi:hypothetical protein Dthio_PD1355 [Desulfonatronospira thiodismutans ASO3-1]|uniref:Chondroitin 4-O-sulfotransferase n=1 Tax=Desulfonatronospira thiodismutans ASO3-1 TaxID=555779 RepID=D6STK0_9BACT|nr:hypothetical protein Dthio_PD1355 [Desulfonatronospira thiodismutans ASO3-1]
MAIISHKNKFIFLKTRKTASGSVEVALAGVCGEQDQLCPTGDGKELGITEQNNQKPLKQVDVKDLGNFFAAMWKNTIKAGNPEVRHSWNKTRRIIKSSHFNAENMQKVCGKEVWNTYYKFCFERNPFDRLVSFYHWRTKKFKNPPSFRDFALAVIGKNKKQASRLKATNFSNRPFYEIDGEIVVDRIFHFENLHEDLSTFFMSKKIPWNGELLHTKAGFRPKKDYREYYDPELRRLCEKAFKFEMEHFKYEF